MKRSADTSQEAWEVMMGIYRKMTPAQKFARISGAYQMGKLLAMAGIRQREGDIGEDAVWRLWAKQHLGEKLFNEVYGAGENAES